jgi:Type II secretion system (T2SS), protein M subtype b
MNPLGALSARFHALTTRERALVAACLLCVGGFAAAKWGVLPARAEYLRNRAAIPQRLATIARYETFRQGQERIDEELFLQLQQLEKWEDGLLAGETASAAGVFLQGLLKPLTQGPDTRVTSIRGLTPARKGAYTEVAVQLEIQTSTEGLALLLADIAKQQKILRVRKLTANAGAYYAPTMQQRREVVSISMVVAGLSTAPVDEKAAGGGEE